MKTKLLLLVLCLLIYGCSLQDKNEAIEPQVVQGVDGLNSLIKQTVDGSCITLSTGLDINMNDTLDDSEIETTNTVCAVDGNNGINSLISTKKEGQCIIVCSGLDSNENGELDESEAETTETICAEEGNSGEDGLNTLVRFKVLEIDSECDHGGVKIYVGLDDNRDGVLQDNEIDEETVICNIKCPEHEPECYYEIVDTEPCNDSDPYSIWLSGTKLKNKTLKFWQDGDNAYLYGIVETYDGQECLIDFTLSNKSLDNDNPKSHTCNDIDTTDWIYWHDAKGTIKEIGGSWETDIQLRGNLPQLGINANPQENKETKGLSFWFWYWNGEHKKSGDVNLSFKKICE